MDFQCFFVIEFNNFFNNLQKYCWFVLDLVLSDYLQKKRKFMNYLGYYLFLKIILSYLQIMIVVIVK